ncbi:autotransporter outer membrane beta-barrel domain-containing protein [Bradyrhizobium liaoningense]|nr:autotransporter outer membrane beta-barrel domain-containing protein [Bradyrhizobium liaoningense]
MLRCPPRRWQLRPSTNAGACGPPASAGRRPRPATPSSARTTARAASTASRSVRTIGSRRTRSRDLRWRAAAPASTSTASAMAAPGWQDITTNRIVTVAGIDHLRAEFNAKAYSGRVESGYRFAMPTLGGLGITPYAAGQFTTFDLPAYAESVVAGSPLFAQTYAAKSVTDTRSELGIRTDKSFAMQNGIVTLRGRLAWAHDFNPDRSIAPTFQSLPGASFVVNGTAQAPDSALTTASAEWQWTNGWSAAATFEGEFSNVTQSYAGKGAIRYAW